MTITPHTFARGSAAPGNSPQPEAGRSAIDISKHASRLRASVVSAVICGVTLSIGGLLIADAYLTTGDAVPSLAIGAWFILAGALFGVYSVALVGRVLRYIYNSELIIASQDLGLQELNADNAWLLARLRRRAGAGEADGAAMNSPSATITQLNGRRIS